MEADVAAANKDTAATSHPDQEDFVLALDICSDRISFLLFSAAADDRHRWGAPVMNEGAGVNDRVMTAGRCRGEVAACTLLDAHALPNKLIVFGQGEAEEKKRYPGVNQENSCNPRGVRSVKFTEMHDTRPMNDFSLSIYLSPRRVRVG